MKIVSGRTGSPHVTSQQFRQMLEGIIGQGSYIVTSGENLKPELSSNNTLKIRSGMMCHHGCVSSVDIGTYDEVTLTNGSQGMKRIDLIVNRHTRNAETEIENCEWKVIMGTPAASNPTVPGYTAGNLQNGDTVDECPVFQVSYDGINVTAVKSLLETVGSLTELNSKLKNAETTMSNNLKSLLSVKRVTVKSNINVGAGKDFECYIEAPTVSGYTPVGIIGYDLVGNWDVWINVSSCYYNSGSNLIYTKGHNFGTGACNALLNAFVLYKKN